MISSMTGFGRGLSQTTNKRFKIEIKSLNSKQLDLTIKVPSAYKEMEVALRAPMAQHLERGKVELSCSVENLITEATAVINADLLVEYKRQMTALSEKLNIAEPADWYGVLLRMPDAIHSESVIPGEDEKKAFFEATNSALESLIEFRKDEGKKLYYFFRKKINRIAELLQLVEQFEVQRVPKIRERLEEQLSKLTSIEYERGRLEQELIFYIEKLDVNEEKLRLSTHLNYFLETMGGEDEYPSNGQGKKLGFIAQEIGREINTLGSKSNQADMQRIVVMMKDELEQIKEQVLNVL